MSTDENDTKLNKSFNSKIEWRMKLNEKTYATSSKSFFKQLNDIIVDNTFTVKAFCPSDQKSFC